VSRRLRLELRRPRRSSDPSPFELLFLGQSRVTLVTRPEDCVLKVLIAEDDLMIAYLVEEVLVDEGCEVCGIARPWPRR
jgi:hypothetical protein